MHFANSALTSSFMFKPKPKTQPNLTSDVGDELNQTTVSKKPLPDNLKRRIAVRRALKGGK